MKTMNGFGEEVPLGQRGEQGPRGPKGSSGLGCLGPFVGIAGLVATLSLGPIDLGRSVYNQLIGDTPVLKQQLINYCKRHSGDEAVLADTLGYRLGAEENINPQKVSIEALWDAAEVFAPSVYQQWVWTSLED